MSEVVSIQNPLTEHWQRALATAEAMRDQAEHNLARLATIYSGQLTLDFDVTQPTLPPEAA